MKDFCKFAPLMHNESSVKQCENTLNSLQKAGYVWLKDEDGNTFVPKGNISVGYFIKTQEETK